MDWSLLEFSRQQYLVCENIGTLTLSVSRTGALDKSAFVSIKVKGMSAKVNEDFVPSITQQLQFDPGRFIKSGSPSPSLIHIWRVCMEFGISIFVVFSAILLLSCNWSVANGGENRSIA